METSSTVAPTLVFLHGVGDGDRDDKWKAALSKALQAEGHDGLDAVRIIAPKYAHALKDWDTKEDVPEITAKGMSRDAARANRRAFEARMSAIENRLGQHVRGGGVPGLDAIVAGAVGVPAFRQARNYLSNAQIRAQVLNRILATLPDTGPIVIVGHSLGSVIAADVLRRLPLTVDVVGMVTIGSPLANGAFDVDKLKDALKEPPVNLAWWVNFWNSSDPVAARRGVSSVIPWLVDFRIDTTKLPLKAHSADEYLSASPVAAAIGFALFGSKSTEIVLPDRGVEMRLDAAESMALMALRYAHLMRRNLKGDQLARFTGALHRVQGELVNDVMSRNRSEHKPSPADVTRLAVDLTNPLAELPEPKPFKYLTKEEAAILLTALAAENVLRPYEIDLPRDKWLIAMKELAAEMGLGTQFGVDVFEAARQARSVLHPGPGFAWLKWGVLGVGAAALVAATGGVAIAAAPGLAGAAAITSALASFGPGGMIGGLLTAGTLSSAGGAGIAFGLASRVTSPETFEAVVEQRLAGTVLRRMQSLEPDPAVWSVLAQTEIEIRREYERMDEFSDESAPGLKDLRRKILIVERALKYLTENGLEPGAWIDYD